MGSELRWRRLRPDACGVKEITAERRSPLRGRLSNFLPDSIYGNDCHLCKSHRHGNDGGGAVRRGVIPRDLFDGSDERRIHHSRAILICVDFPGGSLMGFLPACMRQFILRLLRYSPPLQCRLASWPTALVDALELIEGWCRCLVSIISEESPGSFPDD